MKESYMMTYRKHINYQKYFDKNDYLIFNQDSDKVKVAQLKWRKVQGESAMVGFKVKYYCFQIGSADFFIFFNSCL